jgi:hypothetical protein
MFAVAALLVVSEARLHQKVTKNAPLDLPMNSNTVRLALNQGKSFRKPADKQSDFHRFQSFVATHSKFYSDMGEFHRRFANWTAVDSLVKDTNAKADVSSDPNAVRLTHNFSSDMTKQEKQNLHGREQRKMSVPTPQKRQNADMSAYNVDWIAYGGVVTGKDQGSCGSCYAFSGNTGLESYIAVTEGTTPVHLSEQQIVDCTGNWGNGGCQGGHEHNNYHYGTYNGLVKDSDYPYTGTVDPCKADQATGVAMVDYYGTITDGAMGIIEKLQFSAIAVGVQGENDFLYNYESGILNSTQCIYNYIDHGVTLTGYEAGADTAESETYTTSEVFCRDQVAEDALYEGNCMWQGEFSYMGYCCWWEETTETVTTGGTEAYFTMLNSWGAGWGIDGTAKLAVEWEGAGPCGVNIEPLWATGHSLV